MPMSADVRYTADMSDLDAEAAEPNSLEPRRIIHHGEALTWLARQGRIAGASAVTSLPDLSELPRLGFEAWQAWFQEAAAAVMNAVPDQGVAIFFQSDVRHQGLWVDKGYLVARAAERAGMRLLFHRIVCRKTAGTPTFGRASYSHLLGFARSALAGQARPAADVLPDTGFVPGRKAMGLNACVAACQFILNHSPTRIVVDPFCGWGTVLAAANGLGMEARGVDLSARMCRRARVLRFTVAQIAGARAALYATTAVRNS